MNRETKEVVLHFVRVLPEFALALLVLVSLGIHLGSEAPISVEASLSCQSSVLTTCGFVSAFPNATAAEGSCVCVSDRSFFYGSVAAGAILYMTSRSLFSAPGATQLVFLVAAIFAVAGYTFAFVGVALSISEFWNARIMAVGVLMGLASLISAFETIYEFFKRRRESDYNIL